MKPANSTSLSHSTTNIGLNDLKSGLRSCLKRGLSDGVIGLCVLSAVIVWWGLALRITPEVEIFDWFGCFGSVRPSPFFVRSVRHP